MTRYAESTRVSSTASRDEIERTLVRYGAESFIYGWDGPVALIGFRIRERQVRFALTMPNRQDKQFTHTPEKNWRRSEDAQNAAYEQAIKQRWRALALIIKAKLEAVEAGIVSLEDEFLAQTMLPTGATVGEWAGEQITEVYRSGQMPALLPIAQPQALTDGTRITDVER